MNGKFFWLVVGFVFVVVGHLAYVLFVPEYWMSKKLQTNLSDDGAVGFVALSRQKQHELLPAEDPGLVLMICRFEVKSRPVKIVVPPLKQFWSLSIYSPKGDSFYTINDRQTINTNLKIILQGETRQDESDAESPAQKIEEDKVFIDVPGKHGWAILRLQSPAEQSRQAIIDRAGAFSCQKAEEKDLQ
jgi:uncharacterized membrane protein